jgi:excinuclease ABC subunit A
VIIIEHNLDVIRNADWVIDLGPEGGEDGGRVVGEGRPAKIAATPGSYTGQFLKRYYKSINGQLMAADGRLTPADCEEDIAGGPETATNAPGGSSSDCAGPDSAAVARSNGKRTRQKRSVVASSPRKTGKKPL